MPLASLTRRLLRPRMDGLIGRAPSSGITTAQLAEAAPAHLICRTRRSENRELDLYTPKSARKASSREPYTDFARTISLPKLCPSSIPMKAPGAFSAPLMNLRAELSTELPMPGAPLVTYAYPENAILDFN